MEDSKVYEILLVEDNPAESELIKIAWQSCKEVKSNVTVITDSRSVTAYLHGEMEYEGRPTPWPDLILLDYVMPVDGGIALTEIKGDPDFRCIPVVALTASRNPRDHQQIYERYANCCVLKPNDLQGYLDLICYLADFWLKRVVPPPPNSRTLTSGVF
jgi:CheY-like chemotaxis protein